MNPIDYGDGDYGEGLGSGTSELEGGETRLSLRERFDQLEPKQRLWLLVGVGVHGGHQLRQHPLAAVRRGHRDPGDTGGGHRGAARQCDVEPERTGHAHHRATARAKLLDEAQALVLEREIADSQRLIDDEEFQKDERMPYWAELWPAALGLAEHLLAQRPLRGACVELGAGA